ncbi:MAG TPA: ECF-type sigma factor [Phycisphaerales bacterium]|nr:ECF-type sigma factor [Phycisphaerales bacterium]
MGAQERRNDETLTRVLNGDHRPDADQLYARVYGELRAMAAAQLRRESGGQALETTVLVHEAWLKLAGQGWESRRHFFGAAARAMRQVLVDQARTRRGRRREEVRGATTIAAPGEPDPLDVLALDEALDHLARHDERAAAVVTLRFFGGLEMAEVAEALDSSLRTVERDWAHARAWLLKRLGDGGTEEKQWPDGRAAPESVG